jgi:hypothetical protein
VGTVRQFDQDDADVAGHGQQHLAERLGLVFFPGVEMQFVQLGQAIDQFCNRRSKALDQFCFGDATIFQRVVQQSCHQRLGVHFPLGALGGHRDRVGDVGLPVVAKLAQMGFVRKAVGLANLLYILGRQVVQFGCQPRKAGRRRIDRCGNMGRRRRCLCTFLMRVVDVGVGCP